MKAKSSLSRIYLARHGETLWSISGQHTGHTDIPLTEAGERNATLLGKRLEGINFTVVYTSPLQRASRTCDLAGFKSIAQKDPSLMEWNYGDYEGLTTAEIREKRPDWDIFKDGCPGGETIDQVADRASQVVNRIKTNDTGNILIFSHGHFLRFIAISWLGLPETNACLFLIKPTSLSILGYDRDITKPAIYLWNDDGHL